MCFCGWSMDWGMILCVHTGVVDLDVDVVDDDVVVVVVVVWGSCCCCCCLWCADVVAMFAAAAAAADDELHSGPADRPGSTSRLYMVCLFAQKIENK